jgi:hypothetical protein
MQEIGKQAGVAGQIMAQRQAQQQQQAQNPQAVAQMAAQMLQSKGVAGLPSNMGFKEGGIIGFDGEDGSAVPAPNVPGMDKLMEIMKNAEGTEIASTDNQAALQALAEAQKRLAAATASQDIRAVQIYAKQVADIRREIQSEPSTTPGEVVAQPMAPPRGLPDGTPTLGETFKARLKDIANVLPSGLPAGSGIELLRSAYADKKEPTPSSPQPGARVQVDPTKLEGYGVPAAGPAALPAARVEPQKPPARAAAPATQAPAGGATPDNVANRARGILSSFQAPTAESVMAGVGQYYKDTTEADIAKERALEDERARLKAGMADLKAEGIAALEKDQATRKQLVASKAERDQFNRVQSFFRDLYTRGDSYGTVQAGIFAREEAERLAELNTKKAIIELKEAQKADKLGDVDRKLAAEQRYRGYTEKANQFKLQAAQIEGTRQSNVYQTQGQAATTAANTLSQEKISAETLAAKRAELNQAREDNKDNKAIAAANDAMGRLTNAWKVYEKAKDDNKMGLSISEEVASKDPAAKQLREAAIKAVTETYEKQVTPALTAYNILSQRAFGPDGTVAPSASAGGAKPDFIWDQKTQKMVPNK